MDQLTKQSIDWAMEHLKGKVIKVKALKGGQSSLIHELTIKTVEKNSIQHVILREHHNMDWLAQEPEIVRKEAKNLRAIEDHSFFAPKLIAYDEKASQSGRPSLLMSKLEGKIQLKPRNFSDWLYQLAKTLYDIHFASIPSVAHDYFPYYQKGAFIPATWSTIPEKWQLCFNRLAYEAKPAFDKRFIHRDYHPVNVLWKDEKVSGVVDWPNACMGPREIDLGHCRWNLCMMYGLEAANLFLKYYEDLDPQFDYHFYWDLEALGNIYAEEPPSIYQGWIDFGLTDLTENTMIQRMDQMLENALLKL